MAFVSSHQLNTPSSHLTCHNLLEPKVPLQKLLFSATLSADPEQLEELKLFKPRLFSSLCDVNNCNSDITNRFVGKYTTPEGLTENMVVCTMQEKPLFALHLINKMKRCLCFAGSLENTHKLAVLIQTFADLNGCNVLCSEFSSTLTTAQRTSVMKDFKSGKIDTLVCSDAMARGIDVPTVDHVILYDVPSLIKTYIHRIGRTARAGKKGHCYTLLTEQEVFHFKSMLSNAGKSYPTKMQIKTNEQDALLYSNALNVVSDKLKQMKQN